MIDEKNVSEDILNTKISDQKNESKNLRFEIKTLEKTQKSLDKNIYYF